MYNGNIRGGETMGKKTLLAFLFTVIFLLSGCTFISEQIGTPVERSVQNRMMESKEMLRRSNVGVETTLSDEDDPFASESVKQGSGVIFASRAGYHYFLTNFHVVDDMGKDTVTYKVAPSILDESFPAELVHHCFSRDLAILRFRAEEAGDDFETIDIDTRKDDPLQRREFVFAVGNPHTLEGIVTFGEYLGMSEVDEVDFSVIRHNAAVFTGSSGGALADIDGNLVGINTWGAEAEGVNLAVPLTEILAWLEELDFFRAEQLATDEPMMFGEVAR